MKPLEVWTCQRTENLKKKSSKIPQNNYAATMVSAARQQIIGGGGAPINKRRRPQIVGGGAAGARLYFHLRRLRAIRKSVSTSVFAVIVHAFVCSRIDRCNSLLTALPKVRLSTLQTLLNASAGLIVRLPPVSLASPLLWHTN